MLENLPAKQQAVYPLGQLSWNRSAFFLTPLSNWFFTTTRNEASLLNERDCFGWKHASGKPFRRVFVFYLWHFALFRFIWPRVYDRSPPREVMVVATVELFRHLPLPEESASVDVLFLNLPGGSNRTDRRAGASTPRLYRLSRIVLELLGPRIALPLRGICIQERGMPEGVAHCFTFDVSFTFLEFFKWIRLNFWLYKITTFSCERHSVIVFLFESIAQHFTNKNTGASQVVGLFSSFHIMTRFPRTVSRRFQRRYESTSF